VFVDDDDVKRVK